LSSEERQQVIETVFQGKVSSSSYSRRYRCRCDCAYHRISRLTLLCTTL
jgi:hypothetical protein